MYFPDLTNELTLRDLKQTEFRDAINMARESEHMDLIGEQDWPEYRGYLKNAQVLGAFRAGSLAGICQSIPSDLVLPGGGRGEVDVIGRFARRHGLPREGVGTALMREKLRRSRRPITVLRASEGGIYGRFGFAVGTQVRDITIARRSAKLIGGFDVGSIRLLDSQEAADVVSDIYKRTRDRAGSVGRNSAYEHLLSVETSGMNMQLAVHTGFDGDDGYVRYHIRRERSREGDSRTVLVVDDMRSIGLSAWFGLWKFLLEVELVDEIRADNRPTDEPVEWLFSDPRSCRTDRIKDELWIRIVDVLAGLNDRSFVGEDSIIIDVRDNFVPTNSGNYLISRQEVRRTDEPADMCLGVDALSALYLGTVKPSHLAATGRIKVMNNFDIKIADSLFSVADVPWCGSFI